MIDYALLRRLCAANGVSGDESSIRDIIISEIQEYADEIKIDNLGNLLVHKKGRFPAKQKLMLSAHMDEVGLMVTDITSDGFLKFDEIGGLDRRVIFGKRVRVGREGVAGVVGVKPVHLTRGDENAAIPPYSDMYIDIGADSREEAHQLVSIGDSVCFDSECIENDNMICTKALDDRFGCLVLIALIQSDLQYDTEFAFVVQEEVGLRGAKVAAYNLRPQAALVIETTTAADIPEIEPQKQVCVLGEGAVISVMDRTTIYDKKLVKAAFETAEETGVRAQYKRAVAGGNDAGIIHKSNGGVRTLTISLACRYLHASHCMASKADCESVMCLAAQMAERMAGGDV